MVSAHTQVVAQELRNPIFGVEDPVVGSTQNAELELNVDIALEKIGSADPQPADDKWALTDEDRMTDEEMDEELFGNGTTGNKNSAADERAEDPVDDDKPPAEIDDSSSPKKAERVAPKQTIESYLKSINTLTVQTYSPPPESSNGIDRPKRIVPPPALSYAGSPMVADLRFQIPDIYHQPLYFEDESLEREGVHLYRLQPFESARRFVSDGFSLPRNLRQQPPRSCVHRENYRYSQPSLLPALPAIR